MIAFTVAKILCRRADCHAAGQTAQSVPSNCELRQMIGRGALAEDIHAAALAHDMIDLKRYAALLLTEGLTTVDEVTSVVSIES